MFRDLLKEVDRRFPYGKLEISDRDWTDMLSSLMPRFCEFADLLILEMEETFPKRILRESKVEYLHLKEPSIPLCEVRIRPQNKYYEEKREPIPRPENADGYDATGIQTNISLLRGFRAQNVIYPAAVSIAFQIWGHDEHKGFLYFFRNYRRLIELFLKELNSQFETACWFDNVEKYKGNDIIKKLDLYFLNDDEESYFSIRSLCYSNADSSRVLRAFLILIAIYDSCLGYTKKRKDIDRILSHHKKLKKLISSAC